MLTKKNEMYVYLMNDLNIENINYKNRFKKIIINNL
jgi:hypothetical protein